MNIDADRILETIRKHEWEAKLASPRGAMDDGATPYDRGLSQGKIDVCNDLRLMLGISKIADLPRSNR